MAFNRPDTTKLPVYLVILASAQGLCAAVFVTDVIEDLFRSDQEANSLWQMEFEAIAVFALIAAIVLQVRYIFWLLQHNARLEQSVSIAKAAMRDVIEAHFDEWHLTPSERDVAMLMVKGLSNSEIASIRGSAAGTVKSQLNAVYRKSGTTGRGELLSAVIEEMMG